ncbi:YfiT family bacillithiol transferase [Paenibacillus turpanensis]|uniref:YfiT family bacillithiol transferase n=1 Tax=Paenibacillus turpanensis TaxID=2689078 RepID=UPI0014078FB8|nr:putative metal-dependent hydrolase [Paenibacillus turpanensis]
MQSQRFPIGEFKAGDMVSEQDRARYAVEISRLVPNLRALVHNYTVEQIESSYRLGGWTVKQVIHHMADNDTNAYIRMKRALTEEEPQAHSYREELWAELNDYHDTPIETSLVLLEALHQRLINVIQGMEPADFQKRLHTNALGWISIDTAIQRFIWHNRHHTAHIRLVQESQEGDM